MPNSGRDWNAVLSEHLETAEALRDAGEVLDRIAELLIETLGKDRRVLVAGNGGSAADAQHIAGELLGRFKLNRRALPAIALSTDTSTMTAIGNDLGFDQVFARQVEGLARRGDVVWLLSTSGNSPNILAAADAARSCGAVVVGFTGESGGELGARCDLAFRAPHRSSDRIQEMHLLAYHYLCERVEAALAGAE